MKIIEPKVELWQQGGDAKAHIARCARVCYGRTSGNDEANSKREAANIINGTDAGIIYAIKNNSIYKHKYKIKVLSYGCK